MTSETTAPDPAAPYRDLLAAIREAIDIPHAATVGWEEKRAEILDRRLTQALIALRDVESVSAADLTWHTSYLRERLAEHPPIGATRSCPPRNLRLPPS